MSLKIEVTYIGGTMEQIDEVSDFIAADPWRNVRLLAEAGVLVHMGGGKYAANFVEAEPSEDRV